MSPRSGSTGPRGRRQPTRRTPATAARPTKRPTPVPAAPAPGRPTRPAAKGRSHVTGRAAVLVTVLAVLTVSYASSMHAYLRQRASIAQLRGQIAQHQANIGALESEKKRWNDPAYVRQQARQRLGYVMPGEKSYLVLDQNGKPVNAPSTLDSRAVVKPHAAPTPWWSDAWSSVELAGNPPKTEPVPQPATKIKGSVDGSQPAGG